MQMKKAICMVLVCVLSVVILSIPANAVETESPSVKITAAEDIVPFATGSFNMSVPANSQTTASSSFPLAAGETVTIKASYSPFSASVDFGLVAPDGSYYYVNITDGSIDETVQVSESGSYTLRIRNNSKSDIKVSGFVNY